MVNASGVPPDRVSDAMRRRIRDLRNRMLGLHKTLLEGERMAYERVHGAVSAGELLHLVINHEQFEWLHRISELIVRIDELLDGKQAAADADAEAAIAEARGLLSPAEDGEGFAGKYYEALRRDPAALLSHQEIRLLLL